MLWPSAFFLSFFFSSRRRHTRSTRDWSSDVCSSDLRLAVGVVQVQAAERHRDQLGAGGVERGHHLLVRPVLAGPQEQRSEERRVGKECRSRWAAHHEKKRREGQVQVAAIYIDKSRSA